MSVADNVAPKHTMSGLSGLMRHVKAQGMRAVDGRSAAMKAVSAWKADLVRDLGGDPSAQQVTLVDLAAKTMLYLYHIDSWLMQQNSLIDKRRKSILQVLRERQGLVDSLARILSQLGLERQQKPIQSLSDYIAARDEQPGTSASLEPGTENERIEVQP